MTADSHLSLRAPRRRLLLRVTPFVWLALGCAHWGQTWIAARAASRAWDPWQTLVTAMPWWISWMLLTPIVVVLTERWPLPAMRPWRTIALHVTAGLVTCGIHLSAVGAVYWWTTGRALGVATTVANQIERYIGSFGLEAIVTYAGIAGVLFALDFARAYRNEEVRAARLAARAASLETTLTTARLDALRRQLNPHFLFNTLSAISGLIGQDRKHEARDVVGRLGELLRESLDGEQEQVVAVEKELELVRNYLFIEQIRFGDRLVVELEASDAALRATIPPMMLQPLVENAVRHGVEPSEGPGRVRIELDTTPTHLRVRVSDSGLGFRLDGRGSLPHEGIGIRNTRARLAHLYGDAARLILSNGSAQGASVLLELPRDERPT